MKEELNKAQLAHAAGQVEVALAVYRKLESAIPDWPEVRHFLGLALYQLGQPIAGISEIKRSLCLAPDTPVFWSNFAKICSETSERRRGIQLAGRAAALDFRQRDAAFNLGNLLRLEGCLSAAVAIYQRAVLLHPADFEIYLNLGVAHRESGKYEKAIKAYARCLRLSPGNADVEYSAALCLLATGEYAEGWLGYRARFFATINEAHATVSASVRASRPLYSGTKARRVLVWGEQGLGDELMFGTLLTEFARHCPTLLLQVDRRLKSLFSHAFPRVAIFERGVPIDVALYDEQMPIGDLAHHLRPTRPSFLAHTGQYLFADGALVRRYRGRMGLDPNQVIIGISWRSSAPETGLARTVQPEVLVSALAGLENVVFIDLQYDSACAELETVTSTSGVLIRQEPEVDNKNDLDGLAALITACDFVVTVGNATAHMAGALGKTAFVLLPKVAGWRWLHEGEYCPWYRSLTLLRQTQSGDWRSVIQEACERIRHLRRIKSEVPDSGRI